MCKHIISPLWGQNADTTAGRFRRFDVFPAISYSPETKLTLGVIGYAYFDWRGGDVATPLSFLEFLAVYTTTGQILFENRGEFFPPHRCPARHGVFVQLPRHSGFYLYLGEAF
jgi:hypothetical protein